MSNTPTNPAPVSIFEKIFGANWRTTVTGIGAAVMSLLSMLAIAPYELGDLATVISPEYKKYVLSIGLVAAFVLRVLNSRYSKDKQVHGGSVLVDEEGKVLARAPKDFDPSL